MKLLRFGITLTATMCSASQTLADGLWLNEYGDFAGEQLAPMRAPVKPRPPSHNPASAGRIKGVHLTSDRKNHALIAHVNNSETRIALNMRCPKIDTRL